jgi:hypothetical protein
VGAATDFLSISSSVSVPSSVRLGELPLISVGGRLGKEALTPLRESALELWLIGSFLIYSSSEEDRGIKDCTGLGSNNGCCKPIVD